VKRLGLLESLQTVRHGFRIGASTPSNEDPLIAKSAMNGAQPAGSGLGMNEWATCRGIYEC
jgi:hypothetical protein